MNSRGFTLVELIITIALLSMLFSLIGTNMVGLQSRQMEGNYENYKAEIENAACLFIDSKDVGDEEALYYSNSFSDPLGYEEDNKDECMRNGECYIKTGSLISLGYLNKELKNPQTNKPVTEDEVVRISYYNGEKSCLYYGR